MATSIAVKLSPIATTVKIKSGVAYKVMTGVLLSLENAAKGSSQITATSQPAVLEIFESSDKTKPIATLSGPIKLDGKTPKFDLIASSFGNSIAGDASDFTLELDFASATFNSGTKQITFTLRLPWLAPNLDVAKNTVSNLVLGAQIKIGGQVESPAFKDKLDIPLKHLSVEDDTFPGFTSNLIGVGSVSYPLALDSNGDVLLTAAQTLPQQGTTFQVNLHTSVRSRCEAIDSGSFDLAGLTTNLQTIFTSGGFNSISVAEIPSDAAFNALWRSRNDGKGLISTTVKDETNILNGEGHLVPFFEFLVHSASQDSGDAGELGRSEALADKASRLNLRTKQKRIINPITLPTKIDSEFRQAYRATKANSDKMILLADVIAHEIGHALGLGHGRIFDPSNQSYAVASSIGLMTNLAINQLVLKKLGPVHEAVLKLHYP